MTPCTGSLKFGEMEFGEMKRNTSNWSNFCMLPRRAGLSASGGLSCFSFQRFLHCCAETAVSATNAVNRKCHFPGLPAPDPMDRFSTNFAYLITSATPPRKHTFGSMSAQRVCVRACLKLSLLTTFDFDCK